MNKERVELFLAALESGKYTQCTGRLRQRHVPIETMIVQQRHCALGVATEVALDNGLREEIEAKGFLHDDLMFAWGRLDVRVREWYGFDSVDPVLIEPIEPAGTYELVTTVSRLNDGGKDFWTIAQMGREQWLKDQG